jgi:hypothetical protein
LQVETHKAIRPAARRRTTNGKQSLLHDSAVPPTILQRLAEAQAGAGLTPVRDADEKQR